MKLAPGVWRFITAPCCLREPHRAPIGSSDGRGGEAPRRRQPLEDSCHGLLPGEQKSVEAMAGRLDPGRVHAKGQSTHLLVMQSPWSGETVLASARRRALPAMEPCGPVIACIKDDKGTPDKGRHSVSVTRGHGAAAWAAICGRAGASGASRFPAVRVQPGKVAGDPSGRAEPLNLRGTGWRTCRQMPVFGKWCGRPSRAGSSSGTAGG